MHVYHLFDGGGNSMTYLDMKDAIILAFADDDEGRLYELRSISPKWYDEIVEEIETLMGLEVDNWE